MNGLALQSALENNDVPTRLQTAIKIEAIAEPFIKRRAVRHLEKGASGHFWIGYRKSFFYIPISAAVLRAIEINADVIFKRYSSRWYLHRRPPKKNENAIKFDSLSFDEVLKKGIKGNGHNRFYFKPKENTNFPLLYLTWIPPEIWLTS